MRRSPALPLRVGLALLAAVKLLSGDVYAIDPRTGRIAAFDELTGKFAPRSPAEARRPDDAAAAARAGPQLHTEIAEGSGATASEAIQDALRNAVRQAVGVYMDSETLTDKDDVVSDRALTASDAFVVRYEELSRSTEEGLVTVKLSATARPTAARPGASPPPRWPGESAARPTRSSRLSASPPGPRRWPTTASRSPSRSPRRA
jgi:hypothetical protein